MDVGYKGQGTIRLDGEQVYAGTYIIIKSGPPIIKLRTPGASEPVTLRSTDEPTTLEGVFVVSPITVDRLIHDFGSGILAKELTLTLEDGRTLNVHLSLEQKDFDAEKGEAGFLIAFGPGSVEILEKEPAQEEKKKYFPQIIKRSW